MWLRRCKRHLELVVLLDALGLQQLVAGQHQLADQGHQIFDHVDIDADRSHRGGRRLLRLALRVRSRPVAVRGFGA